MSEPNPHTPYRERTRAKDEQVRLLHAQGLTNADIMRRLELRDLQSVTNSLKRLGLTRNANPNGRGKATPPVDHSAALAQVVTTRCACGFASTDTLAASSAAFRAHSCEYRTPARAKPIGAVA